MFSTSRRPVPEWFWAIFMPAAFFAVSVFVEHVLGYKCFTACEDGPTENIQALVLFAAFVLGICVIKMPRNTYPDWARVFFAIGVIGALYACLEEISYGQRIFGWVTPENWDLVNDQHETNLHNTSAWLDQKPRLILQIGTIIGGIIIPLLRRYKPAALPQKWAVIYPSDALFTTAFFAVFVYVYRYIADSLGDPQMFLLARGSEAMEIYLYWFIFLYFQTKYREFTASTTPAP